MHAVAGDSQTCTGPELIAAADAALLEAKRLGAGRLRLRAPGDGALPVVVERRRGSARLRRRVTDDVIARVVGLLDQTRPSTTQAAVELLAGELGAAGWTLSVTTGNQTAIRAVWCRGCAQPEFGAALLGPPEDEDVVYPLAEYPSTAQALSHGSAFTAGVDLPDSDPSETRVLHQLGYRALLAVGLFDQSAATWLKSTSKRSHRTDSRRTLARVLAHYCVRNVTAGPISISTSSG